MSDAVWLIPALPLAGFLLILLFGRRLGEPGAGYLATAMTGAAFVVSVGVFFDLLSNPAEERAHDKRHQLSRARATSGVAESTPAHPIHLLPNCPRRTFGGAAHRYVVRAVES